MKRGRKSNLSKVVRPLLLKAASENNVTEVYRIYHLYNPDKDKSRFNVIGWCDTMLYKAENDSFDDFFLEETERKRREYPPYTERNERMIAYRKLLEYLKMPKSPYAKRPIYGYTHIYFCSPVYGHKDYNKWRSIPIKGNERFCEILVNVGKRIG